MASGTARGRVSTTTKTESRNMAAMTETRLNLFSQPHPERTHSGVDDFFN